MVLDILIIGISVGTLYSLLAISVSLIYAALDIIHFAQGEIFTLGAFLGWVVFSKTNNFPFALVVGIGGTVLAACLIQGTIYNPILKFGSGFSVRGLTFIVAGFGMSIILQNIFWLIWGAVSKNYNADFGQSVQIGKIAVQPIYFFILLSALVAMAALFLLLQKTQIGLAMRAISYNKEISALMGINVDRTIAFSFGLAAALSALSGILSAQIIFVRYNMAQTILLKAFSAAVIGGLGNILGAAVGGVIVGVSDALGARVIGSEYKDVISFVLMILVLMFKPEGLFATKTKGRP